MVRERRDDGPSAADSPLRAFALTAPDAIVIADTEDLISFVNPAAERMFGYRSADLVGQPVQVLAPERVGESLHTAFVHFTQAGRGRPTGSTMEVAALRSNGQEFPVELSLGTSGDGPARTTVAVIRDATDRHRRDRHLRAQLMVTEIIASDTSSSGAPPRIVEAFTRAMGWDLGALWMVDETGKLRLHHLWQAAPDNTRRFADATTAPSYAADEGLPGVTLRAASPEWYEDLSRAPAFLRHQAASECGLRGAVCLPLISEGAAFGVIEFFTREHMPVDLELRDLLMTVASQVGEHLQRLHVQEDLARARSELERSNDELQQFAHIAAHDLQNPLHTISGFAELLLTRQAQTLPKEEVGFLELIRNSADAGKRLLDNLLEYAVVGGASLRIEEVNTAALVRDVVVGLGGLVQSRGASVEVGDLPGVTADPVQLAQVFQNLISNAIKFTPSGRAPSVTVSASRPGNGTVLFTVADNGVGVDPAEAPTLFEMYGRGAHVAAEGSGIGLAICAKIVARHGGRIWVDPGDDCGSAFRFTVATAQVR